MKPAADGPWMPARRGVQCPYCGERFEAFPDGSGGDQEYIEDCRVCCRPIRFRLRTDAAGNVLTVEVYREDD